MKFKKIHSSTISTPTEKSRFVRTEKVKSSILSINDPSSLAYSLLGLEGKSETIYYKSRLRISELYEVCVREKLLGYFSNKQYKISNINPQMHFTFELGNALHFWLQNKFDVFERNLIGWWECLACGYVRFGTKPQINCVSCNAKRYAFQYKEHYFSITEPYRVTGHLDGLLRCENVIYPIEIKTINKKDFDELIRPLAVHTYQLMGYIILLDYETYLPVKPCKDKGLIFYFAKQHTGKSFPVKTFVVDRYVHSYEEEFIKYTLTEFKTAFNTKVIPHSLEECVERNWRSGRSKRCPMREECERSHKGEM